MSGDYWVMALADDYSYAMVGQPSRENLWILSRTPELPSAIYNDLVRQAKDEGYVMVGRECRGMASISCMCTCRV